MLADMPNVHQKGLVYDVGVNDIKGLHGTPVYTHWKSMLMRCYCEKFKAKHPAYKECSVCEEWKRLSVFKEWFDKNYQEDYELEKDIISKGNKVYSHKHAVLYQEHSISLLQQTAEEKVYTLLVFIVVNGVIV